MQTRKSKIDKYVYNIYTQSSLSAAASPSHFVKSEMFTFQPLSFSTVSLLRSTFQRYLGDVWKDIRRIIIREGLQRKIFSPSLIILRFNLLDMCTNFSRFRVLNENSEIRDQLALKVVIFRSYWCTSTKIDASSLLYQMEIINWNWVRILLRLDRLG